MVVIVMNQALSPQIKKSPRKVGGVIESILRCKWSLTVLDLIAQDTNRPGEIVRSLDGLTTKVLNDCLRTNVKFGVLEKQSFPEVPPRVEYQLTDHGRKLVGIIDQIQSLEDEMIEG